MSEPSFEVLLFTVKDNPVWTIEDVGTTPAAHLARMKLSSPAGAKLAMDVATQLKTTLNLKPGDQVTAAQSRAGGGTMVVFYRGGTPLGLVPNDAITLPK